ncbi:MAG: S9 family peptidase [Dysgonamonadaceae bacterium]|jgi:dipeptidyl aminopeptidase/acylaminoacyl peptidase|nr:S9 family peptidase [Dysgonamonadaceae bacterium]
MKKNLFITTMAAATLLTACSEMKKENKQDEVIIGKPEIQVTDGLMTPEILHSFGQVSDIQISAEQGKILYGVSYADISLNKRNRELFTINLDGTGNTQITKSAKSETNAQWIKQGTKIAFIYEGQLWEMNPDGSQRTKISDIQTGIQGFKYSPDGNRLLFISDVKYGERTADRYPDLDKASGRIVDNLMYKHWDEWVETIPHPFVADYDGKSLSNITDILQGEPFESPMKPSGGIEQLDWSPDGKTIAYTCRKKTGLEYTRSTNSDIYFYNVENGETKNMTEGMMGYDTNPKFSPDGKYLAWQSMERDGYESDKNRLFIMNLGSGEKSYLTENFDYNTDDFCWDHDTKRIFIVACVKGTTQLFAVNTEMKEVSALTEGQHDYASVSLIGDKLLALRHAMTYPNEIFSVDINTKEEKQLTTENKHILDRIEMGKVEPRWIKTTDNKEMLTWIVYPPKFNPDKKYPAILYCQGGPQNTVSQFWSYRWNLEMMAANGYVVVAPNRRGLPGFGQEWNEQISGDYGGQNMKDYLSAIDAVSKEPFVDETKLGCTGASYGGFSVYWLAGNHNKRFKAFLSHAGIFNEEAQYLETEEMWFADWDLGGPFWDQSNSVAQRTYSNSPHKFVQNWDTPIMITHGELDYRILASQGMMAFNAAQLRGIPSRMLIFPDENHWIAQPQNGVLFQREFFRWFDQWLK